MALKLKTKRFGYDAEYYKIVGVHILDLNNQVIIDTALYKDQATRDANIHDHFPVESKPFPLNGVDFTGKDPKEVGYQLLKASRMVDVEDPETKEITKKESNKFATAADC